MSPVKAPVSSMTLFDASAVSEALAVVRVILAEPATDLDR